MRYKIDFENRPYYLQLYNGLKKDIVDGYYPYGSKLPSKRTLSEETGLSIITVEHAYGILEEEGYAEGRERSGFVVVFRNTDGFAASELPFHYHRQMTTHSYDGFPFTAMAKAMRRVLTDYAEELLEKSPNAGCDFLKEAIQRYLMRNRDIAVKPEQIIIGSGAEYLYSLIIGLLGRDQIYGLESPSYEKIEQVYRLSAAQLRQLPLSRDGIGSTALKETDATVLHVTPFRSFPTGVTASASKRHEYIRWSGDGKYLIEDDFESEFSLSGKSEDTLFALSSHDNVIYINSFSKTISPSLRIAYMVLPKRLVKPFEERLGFLSCTVPTYEQYVLAEILESGSFERHINKIRRSLRLQK